MRSEKVQSTFKKAENYENFDLNKEGCATNPSKKTLYTKQLEHTKNKDLRQLSPNERSTITQPKNNNDKIDETPETKYRKISNERDVAAGASRKQKKKGKPVDESHIKKKIKVEEYF